ncbi:transcriptional regulator, MerR family [Labilithrix luteola]|uniref:Transcriptional regulator, MerR family n=1 Tax=Labilithrix luteola TaxID=1391654 RepID=A0A0K1PP24_9BACT|nr:heavy metal-responsive transcriptional regulator [Labilithrix luteola]AKU95285.1 transcriptional regulator, MerR family [Labilithrix luteola]
MTIGELAKAAGVRISTLRFYERRGLLKPASRSRAGYRRFTEDDAARVRFLRRAQELGFSLEELGMMLALSQRRTVRAGDIAHVGKQKLSEIDERIADLRRVRRALSGLLAAQCIDPNEPCRIVAALADRPARASD